MGHLGHTFDIEYVVLWVRKHFAIEGFCVRTRSTLPLLKIMWIINKGHLDAHLGQRVVQQVVCAAVQ